MQKSGDLRKRVPLQTVQHHDQTVFFRQRHHRVPQRPVLRLHGQLQRVTLGFGDVQIRTAPLPPGAEALCALAGPAANLLCAGLFLRILPEFAGVSLALGAFNLLPIFPLDGGRLLRLALRSTRAARQWELFVGLLCCAALLALGLWAARRLQTGLWVLLPALIPAARLLRSCDGI